MPAPLHAFVRPPTPSLARCELLHLPRQPFDLALAVQQHHDYARHLQGLGISVTELPAADPWPDAVFVEDVVVMLDELAILCRPGAESRRGEVDLIRPEIARHRAAVREVLAPGTLEGGDLLRVGRRLFVGRSSRTNDEGIRQLSGFVAPFGYEVTVVPVHGCLHLKTATTSPAPGLILANPAWIDVSPFRDFEVVTVAPGEPWAANTLPVNGTVLIAANAPATAAGLRLRGLEVREVDVSELQKAEAGLTCLSVLWR